MPLFESRDVNCKQSFRHYFFQTEPLTVNNTFQTEPLTVNNTFQTEPLTVNNTFQEQIFSIYTCNGRRMSI
jgi:hypothetical protein